MKALNLGLAFSLELALLVAIAHWGFQLDATTSVHWLATIGAPAARSLGDDIEAIRDQAKGTHDHTALRPATTRT
jgi:Protein of unknown function (DUF2568)